MKHKVRSVFICLTALSLVGLLLFFYLASIPASRNTVPDGFRWERFIDGGYGEHDMPKSVVAGRYKISISDKDKLIFVLGETYNSHDMDVTLRAVNPDEGAIVWSKQFNHLLPSSGNSRPNDRAFMLGQTDDVLFVLGSKTTGDVVGVTGYSGGKSIGFLYKFDKETGKLVWKKDFATELPSESVVDGKISVMRGGDLMVALTTYDITTVRYHHNIFRIKGSTGKSVWENRTPNGRQYPYGLSLLGSDDEWYIAGAVGDSGKYPRSFVSKLDPDTGIEIWRFRVLREGAFNNYPRSVLVSQAHLYLLHSGEEGALVTKIDQNGSKVWTAKFDSGYEESDTPVALLMDGRQNLYACSTCRESWYSPAGVSVCVIKLSAEDGQEEWRTIVPIAETKGVGSVPAFSHQIAAETMLFSNGGLEIFGTSWNGTDLDIFKLTIDRENGRLSGRKLYDGPAGDHDFLMGAVLPYQQYGFVAVGVTSRCKRRYKFMKNLWYLMNGGLNWAERDREINSFDDTDPYNYDELILRF